MVDNELKAYISRVLKQVHKDSTISRKSLNLVNSILLYLFEQICQNARNLAISNNKVTFTAREVQSSVVMVLPGELATHSVHNAAKAIAAASVGAGIKQHPKSRSERANLTFPVGRLHRYIKNGYFLPRVGSNAAVYIAAVLEYLCAEILELSGNVAKDFKKKRIINRYIFLSIQHDDELKTLFRNMYMPNTGVLPFVHPALLHKKKLKQGEDQVKAAFEKQYYGMEKYSKQLTKPAIKRLALRAGVKNISSSVYFYSRYILVNTFESIIKNITTVVEYSGRKTIQLKDVIFVSKFQNMPLAMTKTSNAQKEARRMGIVKGGAIIPDKNVGFKKARKFHPGTVSLKMIRKFQKNTNFLIPKASFEKFVRVLAEKFRPDIRITQPSLFALQVLAEDFMIRIFEHTNLIAIHAKRTVIMRRDMQLAVRVMGDE